MSSSGQVQAVTSSLSPYSSPSRVLSPSASPASSLAQSRYLSLDLEGLLCAENKASFHFKSLPGAPSQEEADRSKSFRSSAEDRF